MASHQFRSSWSGKGHALPVSLFLSYSLHHCGTSVIYIYFIKDKKKKGKITLKRVALLKPVSDMRERNCSQYAFRSGTSTLPSLALLLVNLPRRLKELNDGTHRSWKLWPRTEEDCMWTAGKHEPCCLYSGPVPLGVMVSHELQSPGKGACCLHFRGSF